MKKIICMILASAMILSMTACQQEKQPEKEDTPTAQAEEVTTEQTKEEPMKDDEEAWKKEPAYGQKFVYLYNGGNCTSAPYIAEKMGFFEKEGLTNVEGINGTANYSEFLGAGKAQMGVDHIASMLVPSANGVNTTFVCGAHIGCKSLYVLSGSEYQTTKDLIGKKISVSDGIGNSDYNIAARFFEADGINPLTDIELTQVEREACIKSMETGEIAAAMFPDAWAYDMVKDGTLRIVRSLTYDEDFQQEPCCVIAMNSDFVKKNPITTKKAVAAVKKASEWMESNPEEACQILLDNGKMSGELDKHVELWNTLKFGLSDEFTEKALREIAEDYVKLDLINGLTDVDEIMEKVWTPIDIGEYEHNDYSFNASSEKKDSASAEMGVSITPEEQGAMKKEPMYGQTIKYWYDGGNCTSAPYIAEKMGYFEKCGIQVECLNGTAVKEALGTNAAQLGVSHIASLLVPITNDVDYSFVAGAHIGCKSLYVLADSEYKTTQDLKGKRISTPNGIGNSDYNITAMLLDADGINPITDVELTPVETSACVAAMQSGEIAAALLSDTYAYKLVQDGTLKMIRSLIDEDFQDTPCCVVAMNNTFLSENPVMAKKITECVKAAGNWMRENPEESVQMLLDDKKISGDFDMNLELWNTLNFGLTDEFTEAGLKETVDSYIRLGLITSNDDAKAVMEQAWHPQAPEK